MSCYGCSKKYGLFCKEYGCPNCGYSYCAKCLKFPLAVPKRGDQVLNVCIICCDKLQKMEKVQKIIDCDSLPGSLVTGKKNTIINEEKESKSLFETDIPCVLGDILVPLSSSKNRSNSDSKSNENSEIVDNLDSNISKRLQNLKTVDNMATDEEMRSRLNILKGLPDKDYSKKDILFSTDTRTDEQKTMNLLEEFMGDVQIGQQIKDERVNAMADIERRLKALREDPIDGPSTSNAVPTYSNADTPSDNENEEEFMINKILAQVKLKDFGEVGHTAFTNIENELNDSIPVPSKDMKSTDLEELPWCNICNEDATFRCKGCDGDLFCASCYSECHDNDEEYKFHKKESYSAPPKFKENHF